MRNCPQLQKRNNEERKATRVGKSLRQALPLPPANLGEQVSEGVRRSLRLQNRIDNIKWVGGNLAILFFVLAAQWIFWQGTGQTMEELSGMVAKTESGKKLTDLINSQSLFQSLNR